MGKTFHEDTTIVRFPIFAYYNVRIVVTNDIVQSRNKRSESIGETYVGTNNDMLGMHAHDRDKGGGHGWIFINHDTPAGVIAHECFHAVWWMMDWIGATLENEVFAYHLGYLVEQTTIFQSKVDKKHF